MNCFMAWKLYFLRCAAAWLNAFYVKWIKSVFYNYFMTELRVLSMEANILLIWLATWKSEGIMNGNGRNWGLTSRASGVCPFAACTLCSKWGLVLEWWAMGPICAFIWQRWFGPITVYIASRSLQHYLLYIGTRGHDVRQLLSLLLSDWFHINYAE